jgi:20S proteasome alpha/beta subunit
MRGGGGIFYTFYAAHKFIYFSILRVEQGHPPLVETAARLCKQFCYDYKDKFLAGLIVAGWDPVVTKNELFF